MMTLTLFSTSEGLINRALAALGYEGVDWYLTPGVWPYILTVISAWKIAGYNSIIFGRHYGHLLRILRERPNRRREPDATDALHNSAVDAADRDDIGALGIGRIFYGDFGMIYAIIGDNGILFPTTDVIDTYAFRALRRLGNFSMSAPLSCTSPAWGLSRS